MKGGPPYPFALMNPHRAIHGRASTAVPEQPREHLLLTLIHLAGGNEGTGLEDHHVEPRLGSYHRHRRSTSTRTNDDQVRSHHVTGRQLRGVEDHRTTPPCGSLQGYAPGAAARAS